MDRTASCPACAEPLFAEDAFCSACGTRIRSRASSTGASRATLVKQTVPTVDRVTCPSCNSLILSTDAFCSVCGAPAAAPPMAGVWAEILRKLGDANAGKYVFIRQLGRGGMGTVYLARDLALERLVAIKVLSPDWLANETMVERFRREARTIARLRHPSIVTVYGVGRTADIHYFVMDYIDGASLSDVLRTHGPLSIPVIKAIAYQVGSALEYAHQPGRGIIHRDIKPSNIVLDTEGNAFVMDFGISKVSESKTGLTRTGVIMGTPEYMSPEQCRGNEVDQASDQYSFGTVIYSMLTGAPPFTGPSYRVLVAHNTHPPPDLSEARPDCPEDLTRTTERMLAKAPPDRWPNIGQALRAAGIGPVSTDEPVRRELAGLVRITAKRRRSPEVDDPSPGELSPGLGERTPTWLRILQVPQEIEPGDSFVLRATVLGGEGAEAADQPVSWESTDPSILRVESSTGELVAIGVGSASVTARSGTAVESVLIEVRPERVAYLELVPATVEIPVGRRVRLEAAALSKRGESLDRAVFWSSGDPSTATVSDQGLVQAHAVGNATILAHCEGVASTATIGVVETATGPGIAAVPDVEADVPHEERDGGRVGEPTTEAAPGAPPEDFITSWPDTAMREDAIAAFMQAVGAGKEPSTPASSQGSDLDEDPVAALPEPGSRRESPPDRARRRMVLAMTPLALLTAVAALWLGQRVWFDAGDAVAEVSVRSPDDEVVGALGLTVSPGDRLPLAAAVAAADGSPIPDASVAWASLDPSIVTLDRSGVLTALAPGSTEITVTVDDIVSRLTVHVRPPGVVADDDSRGSSPQASGGPGAGEPGGRADGSPEPPLEEREAPRTTEAPNTVPIEDGRPIQDPDRDPAQPPPTAGTFLLIVDPWANVFVDGEPQGQRQRLRMLLPPGEHRLTLENPERATVDTTFTIRSEQATQLNIPMPSRNP